MESSKISEKELIGKIRNSAFTTNVDNKAGAPKDTFKIGERVIVAYENSIYELMFADSIDPERNISDLPPMFPKLIFEKGANSNIVSKVLLTAKTIFQQQYFQDHISCKKILKLSLEMLNELDVLNNEIDEYNVKREEIIKICIQRNNNSSFHLPAIVSLETTCKTIFQKADHIEQILMDIIICFYPNQGLTKQSHFPKFCQFITNKYGEESDFSKFVNGAVLFMKIIRCIRNGIDHRLNTVEIVNFKFEECGRIACPTIKLNHKDTELERIALVKFFEDIKVVFINIIEGVFSNLAAYNVRKDKMPWVLKLIPEKDRRNKFVRYSFWLPFGEEGMYLQNSNST